jgi:Fe-S cluster biogenesis protein NfuA/nitrite reductase/ring-hydroxylating ferredoxin subunit
VDDQEARDRIAKVEALLEAVESFADPGDRETATELVQALLDLYGEGLARLLRHTREQSPESHPEALAGDELVSHLLLVHDLHPVPLETRVRGALEEVRPYLESHGGDVELRGVADGVVRLRLEGSCSGCPASSATLKLAIEEAIRAAAPEVEAVEAEGVTERRPASSPKLIQLPVAGDDGDARGADAAAESGWSTVGALPELSEGRTVVREVAGQRVLFLRVENATLAYRPRCPGCWKSLASARLEGAELRCAACGTRYDVRRAGRCPDAPDLMLDPVPLLETEARRIKVAVGSAAAA